MIAVVDSGTGNLRSVEKALARVGGRPVVTADPDRVRRADKIVVPGQGAFRDCVAGLSARGLDDAVREAIAAGRPYLGICLGLQVLFDTSEEGASAEGGACRGLGLLPGKVVRLRPTDPRLKVPHMGWNSLRLLAADPLFAGLPDGAFAYFVHSYYVRPADPSIIAATSEYDGALCAAVRRNNVFACQFHPEKSQRVGLQLLANFVEARA